MSIEATLSSADILTEIVDPDRPTWSPQVAQEFLSLGFNDHAKLHIRGLLQKNNAGDITAAEKATLDNYLHVGRLLDLLQAKARLY